MRSALGGDDAGETHHATLRRRVGRSAGVHVIETRAGGRVENAPTPPCGSHGGEGGARTGEGPRQVHGHDPCPGVLRERLDGMARRDARVVHQDVEPTEGLEGRPDDRLAGCHRPDRLQARRGLTARGANLLHHRGSDAGVCASPVEPATDVVDDDARARGGERPGIRAAESAPRTRDDRHAAGERLHAPRYSRGSCAVNGVDSAEFPW